MPRQFDRAVSNGGSDRIGAPSRASVVLVHRVTGVDPGPHTSEKRQLTLFGP
jgi:hypothetical protein